MRSTQLRTLNHHSTPARGGGDTGPSDLKGWRSQIVLKETGIFGARTQNLTVFFPNEQRMVSKKRAKLLSAADSSPLSPWASCYSPAGQTRTVEASMMPPLWSWRRRKGSVMHRRDFQCLIIAPPALLNQTFSSSHDLEKSKEGKKIKVWRLSSLDRSGGTGGKDEHNMTCVSLEVWSGLKQAA